MGERVQREVGEVLSVEELLAGLLDPRRPADAPRHACRQLLGLAGGLLRLARMSPREVSRLQREVPGLPRNLATRLASAFELGRRVTMEDLPHGPVVRTCAACFTAA
ncbi:MAG: hypothetical protein ACYTG2_12720 [Planctomycetota bacterium]